MSLFGALSISATGADAMQTWMDTSAGNIANMDDAEPVGTPAYGQQTPDLAPVASETAFGSAGEGVEVARVSEGTTAGVVAYEPTSPLANAQGDVVVPNVDLGDQLVGMIEAQESYQADTVMMQRAQTAYTAGLSIGT